jgi:hypothetical protein
MEELPNLYTHDYFVAGTHKNSFFNIPLGKEKISELMATPKDNYFSFLISRKLLYKYINLIYQADKEVHFQYKGGAFMKIRSGLMGENEISLSIRYPLRQIRQMNYSPDLYLSGEYLLEILQLIPEEDDIMITFCKDRSQILKTNSDIFFIGVIDHEIAGVTLGKGGE